MNKIKAMKGKNLVYLLIVLVVLAVVAYFLGNVDWSSGEKLTITSIELAK